MNVRERKNYAVAAQSSIANFLSIDGFVAATASLALSVASLIAHKQVYLEVEMAATRVLGALAFRREGSSPFFETIHCDFPLF